MADLRLKIRNKIYTSGNHIVDTRNNNNAIIVFLGNSTSDCLKSYIDNFLEDTLKSQIPAKKISFVQVDKSGMKDLPAKMAQAVKNVEFNPIMKNELFISFVTIMDDEMYDAEYNIDVSAIEALKVSVLGGYAVEIFYDFYGIFVSGANYERRLNARKTIVNFLSKENGGINIQKRIYHQACPGDDYYRSAKSITFMILVNLIGKINEHTVLNSEAEGNNYTWTTFALFEKNLASLVIYEMVNKLLENQVKGTEIVPMESIIQKIKNVLHDEEIKMKKIASAGDIDYIPVVVRKIERKLSFVEKSMNMFKKDKISSVEFRKENEEGSINDLLFQQKTAIDEYVENNITDAFADSLIKELIHMCTVMSSINNSQNEALIYKSLTAVKNELINRDKSSSYSMDYYVGKYNDILLGAQVKIIDKILTCLTDNINIYVENVQNHWNAMNMEVSNMINDFAAFQSYFEGIGDLISDKAVNLLCTYDDILEKIDVHSVIKAINANTEIYSNILSSYYDNVEAAGEIAQKFGNRNIVPAIENIAYYLFSASPVACPGKLKLVNDDYWFRDYEIAILFTAKNNMSDCDNLPYGV